MFMINIRLIALIFVFSIMLTLTGLADSRNAKDEGNIPIICTLCGESPGFTADAELGDVDPAYPGHIVDIPLVVDIDESKTITTMSFYLDAQSGLEFLITAVHFEGTGWDGDTSFTRHSGSDLTIDFTNGSQSFDNPTFMANIRVQISETANWNGEYLIEQDPSFPPVLFYSEGGQQYSCHMTIDDGEISISGDYVDLRVEKDTAYSYQAQNANKNFPITLPVYFYAEFPVQAFRISFDITELDYDLIIDFDANTQYSLDYSIGEESVAIWDDTEYEAPYPVNEDVWIGDLKVKGTDYNDDPGYENKDFSTTDYVSFEGLINDFYCDSTSGNKSAIPTDFTASGAFYPVYRCSTFIETGYVDAYLDAYVPVRANHTFWAQPYTYWIRFHPDSLTFEDVSVPDGFPTLNDPVDKQLDQQGYQMYEISTESGLEDNLYITADANQSIMTLHFTVSEDMAEKYNNKASVGFSDYDQSVNFVLDYFHDYGNKIKVEVDDGSDWFYLSDGEVKVPFLKAVSIDTSTSCAPYNIDVPVNVYRITNNIFDSLSFKILCPEIDEYEITGFSTTNASYNYKTVNTVVSQDGDHVTVNIKLKKPGGIGDEGCIGEIELQKNGSGGGFYGLNWDYCNFFLSGIGPVSANPQINGGIDCGSPRINVLQLPDNFSVSQNYPNPFNARTKIAFNLTYDAYVNITIYDIMGRQTRNLIDDVYHSGKHIVEWDGKDNTGNTVASGFYFYRFEADEYATVKKMLMLK